MVSAMTDVGIRVITETLIPLQSLCEAPGGAALLGAGGQMLQGLIVVVGIFAFGLGLVKARRGGADGSAQGRKKMAYGVLLLAAGLLFFDLVGFVSGDVVGVGLAEAGVSCIAG